MNTLILFVPCADDLLVDIIRLSEYNIVGQR